MQRIVAQCEARTSHALRLLRQPVYPWLPVSVPPPADPNGTVAAGSDRRAADPAA